MAEVNAIDLCQDVSISCESEYKDYIYNQKVDIWTLVSLKAPKEIEEDNEDKRAPIDLVAVIDKSGSMAGEKLDLVKKTLEFVLTQLKSNDRLSVVTYDTQVNLDFGLRNMDKEGKDFALEKIKSIQSGSMTNLSGGLMKGLCQMIDRKEKNEVASVLLFTDGLANHGITSVDGIVAAMKDPKRFDGVSRDNERRGLPPHQQQPGRHQGWLSNIRSNINQQQAQSNQQQHQLFEEDVELSEAPPKKNNEIGKSADATVYTFGFGSDHNPDMLTKISEAGNGMYYYIENEDKIAESFAHCLGGLMSTSAQGIQLQIQLEDGVHIKDVHTARPFEKLNNDKSIKIDIGDLQAEEKRDVVLQLTLDAVPQPFSTTPQQILTTQVDYFNVLTSQLGNSEAALAVFRPETIEPRKEENAHREVGKQKARIRVTGAMRKATAAADAGNYEGARKMMAAEVSFIRLNENRLDPVEDEEDRDYYGAMAMDLEVCTNNIGTSSAYQSAGSKVQRNMMQQYEVQRSSNIDSSAFASKGKQKKMKSARSWFGNKTE